MMSEQSRRIDHAQPLADHPGWRGAMLSALPVGVVVGMADLLTFMERQLARYELKGDTVRAAKLKKVIREWKAMDREQRTLSSL